MEIADFFFRFLAPKRYRIKLLGQELEKENALREATSSEERLNIEKRFKPHLIKLEKLISIQDDKMIRKAEKMDIFLTDIPTPERDKYDQSDMVETHYCYGSSGEIILDSSAREELKKRMRERSPAYRKEQLEYWELWIKIAALAIGLIGTATGFISVIKLK